MKKVFVVLSIIVMMFMFMQTSSAQDFNINFDDIKEISELKLKPGSGLNLASVKIDKDLYFGESGQSIRISDRSGFDYRLKFLDAIENLKVGKKYYISMWATVNDNANTDSGKFYLGVYSSEPGKYRAVYNDKDSTNTGLVVTKNAWVKLGLVYTAESEFANMIGIEQAESGVVVSDVNIDNVSVVAVEDDFVPDDVGNSIPRQSFSKEKIYDKFTRIGILKLDDVKANDASFDNLKRVKEILDKYNIKAGFGFIAKTFEETNSASYFEQIKKWNDDGIEIWNHGYAHTVDEYSTNTEEQMYKDFKATQDILLKNTGIEMKTFGSPFNNASAAFIEMLKKYYPDYETLLLVSNYDDTPFLHLWAGISCETAVGRPSLEMFQQNFNNGTEYMVMQMHAPYFNDDAFVQFEEIIKYCLDNGVIFMTPHEYYEYENSIKLVVDRERLLCDVMPVMKNDRVLVPVRAIFEKLGADVLYDDKTGTVTAQKDGKIVKLTIGSKDAEINGKAVLMDVVPEILNDRTLVPVRFVSEALGRTVLWDEENNAVIVKE